MSYELLMPFLTGVGLFFLLIFGFFVLFKAFYIKVPQGTALIVNDMSATPKVHFTGALVYRPAPRKRSTRRTWCSPHAHQPASPGRSTTTGRACGCAALPR